MDLIRSGKAPEVIRRKGAAGTLPLPLEDKIEILTLLATSSDAELGATALGTLRGWDRVEIRRVMANPQTAPDVLRFAAQELLAAHPELGEILRWNPSLPAECRHLVQPKSIPKPAGEAAVISPPAASVRVPAPLPEAVEKASKTDQALRSSAQGATVEVLAKLAAGKDVAKPAGAQGEVPSAADPGSNVLVPREAETLIERIGRMTVVEKMRAALTGNLETRSVLIRDSAKIVARAVLQSPRVTEAEIEGYAAAKNVTEDVLRLIAANRKFMKSYVVVRALVNNPRVPIDVTLHLVTRLSIKDLKGLSLNRNVPDVIRTTALKTIKQNDEANRPRLPGKQKF